MVEIAENIATKLENRYCGLASIQRELVEEINKALEDKEHALLEFKIYVAVDSVYPMGNMPASYVRQVIREELMKSGLV